MLQKAEAELGIDLGRSFVVGDRIVDVQAGQAVGARGILVLTGYGVRAREECLAQGVTPDFIAASVTEAVAYILQEHRGETTKHG
jgi:D-glycero-D-manno-heptose 1,7-bisphosphate phosphatase